LFVFLRQYKEGSLVEQVEQIAQKYVEQTKLNKDEFYEFLVDLHQTFNETLGGNEKFDDLIKFIDNQQPQLSTTDRTRAHTRHQWLKRLENFSSRNVENLSNELFEIVQRDVETFGGESSKNLSVYLATIDDDKNEIRYIAATKDHEDILRDKTLKRPDGISFQIVDAGKWAYVNQTKNHSRLVFFNSSMKTQSGSFVLMPIKRLKSNSIVGLLGLDTIRDKKEKAFSQHEVQFYEGVASALATTFSSMHFERIFHENFQRFLQSIEKRCRKVSNIDLFFYEPVSNDRPAERKLKHVLRHSNGQTTKFEMAKTIDSRDEIFKFYLEYAAITGQSTTNFIAGEKHFIEVLKENHRFTFALIDVKFADENLSLDEENDLIDAFRCLSMLVDEILRNENEKFFHFEKQSENLRLKNLFDRISFVDVCYRLKHVDENKIEKNDQTKEFYSIVGQTLKKNDVSLADLVDFDPTGREFQSSRVEQFLQKIDRSKSSEFIKLLADWLNFAEELSNLSK